MANSDTLDAYWIKEELANMESLHMLSMHHDSTDEQAFIDAFKIKDRPEHPYYSFGWRTHFSELQAAELMADADKLPGLVAVSGVFIVCSKDGSFEYDWTDDETGSAVEDGQKVEDLEIEDAGLVRLDIIGAGAIVWDKESPDFRTSMGIITHHDIQSPWIQEVFDKTATSEAKEIVQKNLGQLATRLAAFLQLPFGECSLETGFASRR